MAKIFNQEETGESSNYNGLPLTVGPFEKPNFFKQPILEQQTADRVAMAWQDRLAFYDARKGDDVGKGLRGMSDEKTRRQLVTRLGQYRDFKKETGHKLFSHESQARTTELVSNIGGKLESWDLLLSGNEFLDQLDKRGFMEKYQKAAKVLGDSEELRDNFRRSIFLQEIVGQESEDAQVKVSKFILKSEDPNVDFLGAARDWVSTTKDKTRLLREAREAGIRSRMEIVPDDDDGGFGDQVREQYAVDPSHARAFIEGRDMAREDVDDVSLAVARRYIKGMTEGEEIAGGVAQEITQLYGQGKRGAFLKAVTFLAPTEGKDVEGFWNKIALSHKRGTVSIAGDISNWFNAGGSDLIELVMNQHDGKIPVLKEGGQEPTTRPWWQSRASWEDRENQVKDTRQVVYGVPPYLVASESSRYEYADEEETVAILSKRGRGRDVDRVVTDLKNLRQQTVRIKAEATGIPGDAEQGLYDFTQSLPYMAMTMVPGGVAGTWIAMAEDERQQLLAAGYTESQAKKLGDTVAMPMAAIEMIQGRTVINLMPGGKSIMGRLKTSLSSKIGSKLAASITVGASIGAEYGEETLQEALTPLTTEFIEEISDAVPTLDQWEDFHVMDKRRFWATLPLSLLAGSGGAANQKVKEKEIREWLSDTSLLAYDGFLESEQGEVAEALKISPQRALEKVQEIHHSKTPEEREKIGLAAMEKTLKERIDEDMGEEPWVTPVDGKWKVNNLPAGEETFSTPEEAQDRITRHYREDSVSNVTATNELIEIFKKTIAGTNEVVRRDRRSLKEVFEAGEATEADLKKAVEVYHAQEGDASPKSINLEDYYEDGSVVLKEDMSGFIVTLAKEKATPLTVTEEFSEGFVRTWVAQGHTSFDEVRDLLDEFGAVAGIELLQGYDIDPNRAVTEGFSKFVQAYMMQGKTDKLPQATQDWMNKAWYIMENRGSLSGKLRAMADYFLKLLGKVFELANKIREHADVLNPDLESLAQRALGIKDEQIGAKEQQEFQEEIQEELGLEEIIEQTDSPLHASLDPEENSKRTKTFAISYLDEDSGMEYRYLEDSEAFSKLKKDYITQDKTIENFNGDLVYLHQPDGAFSGLIYKNGKLLVEGQGGVYFPIRFHDEGFFWAGTDNTAQAMAGQLNEMLEKNGNRIYLALTSSPVEKLLSSTTMANGVMDFFKNLADSKNIDISESDFSQALIKAANFSSWSEVTKTTVVDGVSVKTPVKTHVSLGVTINEDQGVKKNLTEVKKVLPPNKSTFPARKQFVVEFIREMVAILNKNDNATKQVGELLTNVSKNEFYSQRGKVENRYNLSPANVKQSLSDMFAEPLIKPFQEMEGKKGGASGYIYAVLEMTGPVGAKPSAHHPSYPMVIKSTSNQKTILHILKVAHHWSDVVEDYETNQLVKPGAMKRVFPSAGVSHRGLKVNTSKINKNKSFDFIRGRTFAISPEKDSFVEPGFYSNLEAVIETKMGESVSDINEPAVTGRSFPAKTIKGKDGKIIKEIAARKEADKPARLITAVDQIITLLTKNGVKEEELKWSGLAEAGLTKDGKVSKKDLLTYLRSEGRVTFKEVTMGGGIKGWKPTRIDRDGDTWENLPFYDDIAMREELLNAANEWRGQYLPLNNPVSWDEHGKSKPLDPDGQPLAQEDEDGDWEYFSTVDGNVHHFDSYDEAESAKEKDRYWIENDSVVITDTAVFDWTGDVVIEFEEGYDEEADDTKFRQWTLPGGSRYREIVVASTGKDRHKYENLTLRAIRDDIRPRLKDANIALDTTSGSVADGAQIKIRELGGERTLSASDITDQRLREDFNEFVRRSKPNQAAARVDLSNFVTDYKSSHFSHIPNYVAHMRIDERPGGLFVQEFQSDRHQQGREHGYKLNRDEKWAAMKDLKKKEKAIENHLVLELKEHLVDVFGALQKAERTPLGGSRGYETAEWLDSIISHLPDLDRRSKTVLAKNPESQVGRESSLSFSALKRISTAAMTKARTSADIAVLAERDFVGQSLLEYKAIHDSLNPRNPSKQPNSAPFKSTPAWALNLFKRALRMAVEADKKWIGWTKGETQNKFYNLSDHISEVEYSGSGVADNLDNLMASSSSPATDTHELTARGTDGRVVYSKVTPLDELEGVVGKELAGKIIKNEERRDELHKKETLIEKTFQSFSDEGGSFGTGKATPDQQLTKEHIDNKLELSQIQLELSRIPRSYSGLDLNVGGEAMVAFYDKMLVNSVDKYVAKWGAKTETGSIVTDTELDDVSTDIWRVEITEAMVESVQAGQPTFAVSKASDIEKWVKSKAAKEVRDALASMKLTPTKAMVEMMGSFPTYLNPVVDFIAEQRQKLKAGTLTNRDIAKSYWMTLSSIGSQAINLETLQSHAAKVGISFNPEPLYLTEGKKGQKKIRPEEAAAWWLGTSMGQRALDEIELGVIDEEAWENGMAFRDGFGRQDFRPSKSKSGGLGKLKNKNDFNLTNINDLTQAVNETRGDITKLEPLLLRIKGIAEGKKGFIGHMLGVGDFATIDAVELNVWLTGEGATTWASKANKKKVKLAKSASAANAKPLFQRIQKRIKSLREKADGGTVIPPEFAAHIIHHWIWDAAKGDQTTHEGMYLSMRTFAIKEKVSAEQADAAIKRLFGGPTGVIEVGKKMRAKLEKIRKAFEEKIDGDASTGESREIETLNSLMRLNAIASVLPKELRSVVGSPIPLVKLKGKASREKNVIERLDKIQKVLNNALRKEFIEMIDKLIDKSRAKKKGASKAYSGKITPDGHLELSEIEKVLEMTDKEVAKAIQDVQIEIARLEREDDTKEGSQEDRSIDRDKELLDAETEMVRLSTFGKIRSSEDPMSAEGVEGAFKVLQDMVKTGSLRYRQELLTKQEDRKNLIKKVLDVVTGGKGRITTPERQRGQEGRKVRDHLRGIHAKSSSFEMLLNALSRKDSDSESMGSYLNTYFGVGVHKATHGEKRESSRKKLQFITFVAETFGIEVGKLGWQGKVEAVIVKLSEPKKGTGVFREEQIQHATFKTYREEAEAVVRGETSYVHDGYGFVELSLDEVAELEHLLEQDAKAVDKNGRRKAPKQNFEIKRTGKGIEVEQYMSQDTAMFLTMMHRQEGLRPAMERHGYTETTMAQMEAFLTPKARRIRFWLFRKYDSNYDYFNETYRKMFGVDIPKIKNYSPARQVHSGGQVREMIDTGTTKQSVTPGMAIERVKHMNEPRYDAGAMATYIQHVDATEHFVHWAEVVGDLRAVFMNKEVRESIYDYHGEETYTALLERIEMLAAGGQSMIARDVFVDHLRKTFTIAKLSFNWGVFLKQLTSLPAYAFDMPVKEFLKYEAEFFSSPVENWKKMWSLEYTKNRFDEGYDRDVMLVLSDLAANKSKLAKLAEFGMISGRAGDIMPVIVGGFAVYSHAKAKALAEKKSESEAEALAVLEFEMVTDRAQQSGNLKDQSHYGLQGSFMRVLTMFQTSPRQYYLNMAEAIGDARAGRKGGAQKAAKAAVIAQVVLPSLFYWTSAFTRNLFKDDEEEEDLDELLKGWGASMLLGPFSGIFLWGQIGSELTSGYDYRLPVIEWGGGIGDGVDKLAKMWGKSTTTTTRRM